MHLDLPTVASLVSISLALQSAAFLRHLWLHRRQPGLGWWALSSVFITCGFAARAMGNGSSLDAWTVVLSSGVFLAGVMSVEVGLLRFVEQRENRVHLVGLLGLSMAGITFSAVVRPDRMSRTAMISLALAVAFGRIVRVLQRIKTPAARSTIHGLIAVYASASVLFLTRAVVMAIWIWHEPGAVPGDGTPQFARSMVITSIVALLLQSVSTYGLMALSKQRQLADGLEGNVRLGLAALRPLEAAQDGDKLAVMKLWVARGQVDEALAVALSISPSDVDFSESVHIAVSLLLGRGEQAQAARILLQLLDAPLELADKFATARQAADLFLTMGDGIGTRQVLDRLVGQFQPGSAGEAWRLDMQRRLAELPSPTVPAVSPLSIGQSPARSPIRASSIEPTETISQPRVAEALATHANPGGQTEQSAPLAVIGKLLDVPAWPFTGVQVLANRYCDLERIGQGNNGVVFRAHDQILHRPVVIKFMLQGAMASDTARKYFLREANLAAGLNHPNIVHIYDMDDSAEVLWYAMEYVDGLPLTSYMDNGQPVGTNCFLMSVLEQLCGALDYAHENGLVHRDLKPDNVLMAADGTLKLLDFGLARAVNAGFGELSVLTGTPNYMAPEQLDGSEVDHRADIYSLGVVLYRMFTGVLPFTEGNIFVAHATEPVPDPRIHNPGLTAGIVAVIERCLAKQPSDRYDNCWQVARDIRAELYGNVT